MFRFASLLIVLIGLGACVIFGARPGQECERTGDGFTSQDPCATECFDFVGTCPDGTSVNPMQCIYSDCEPGVTPCETGQVCVLRGLDEGSCVDASVCDEAL